MFSLIFQLLAGCQPDCEPNYDVVLVRATVDASLLYAPASAGCGNAYALDLTSGNVDREGNSSDGCAYFFYADGFDRGGTSLDVPVLASAYLEGRNYVFLGYRVLEKNALGDFENTGETDIRLRVDLPDGTGIESDWAAASVRVLNGVEGTNDFSLSISGAEVDFSPEATGLEDACSAYLGYTLEAELR